MKPKFDKKEILLAIFLTVALPPIGIGYIIFKFIKALKEIQERMNKEAAPIISEARNLL